MERRSAKKATPRKRYTVDAFEGIEELQGDIFDDDLTQVVDRAEANEEDFRADAEPEPEEDESSDGEAEVNEEASEGGSDARERELDDISIADDVGQISGIMNAPRSRKRKVILTADGERTYIRALPDVLPHNVGKATRQLHLYGPSASDYEPTYQARIKWDMEPCLPSRKEDRSGFGGMHHSFAQTEEARRLEILGAWKWYHEQHGREAFRERQVLHRLSAEEASPYMPTSHDGACSLVMGPYNNQKFYNISVGQSVPITDAFTPAMQTNGTNVSNEVLPASYKAGFMLNLGVKVHCLAWLPGQTGSDQYLAVSVLPRRDSVASAFSPHATEKTSIQIWRFTANEEGFVDRSASPRLSLVLCAGWCDVRALQWCHITDRLSGELKSDHLGLLAGIWCDGAIRVLDVPQPLTDEETHYMHVKEAAFESQPPGTICTCLTWISSTRLAAGCANGCVAIWDLAEALGSPAGNARPQSYSSICTGYVLSITICYPSHPNHIMTSSMDSYLRLTDLTKPNFCSPIATTFTPRSRAGHSQLLWHEHGQIAFAANENSFLKGFPLRRFFNTIGLGKLKSTASAFAGSPCHPFVLAGMAGGEVIGVNPTRRVMDGRAELWQQTWFAHEWRRQTVRESVADVDEVMNEGSENQGAAEAAGSSAPHHASYKASAGGLSRITEGYKPERVTASRTDNPSAGVKDDTVFATIYEQETAITALAWNPNLHVGGWAAAGMADGLLRIEDIAS